MNKTKTKKKKEREEDGLNFDREEGRRWLVREGKKKYYVKLLCVIGKEEKKMVMCHCLWSQCILSGHFSLDGTREYRHI